MSKKRTVQRTPEKEGKNAADQRTQKMLSFLHALAECGNVSRACEKVGIGRTAAYEWRESDADFAAGWEKAMKIGTAGLEDEARRRAFEGVLKPVFFQGVKLDEGIREYSDTLLMFLLKAHDPQKYRENMKIEHSGSLALTEMTEDEIRAEIAALAAGGFVAGADEQPG